MEETFIGNYKIIEKIGAGGMAKVYLAVHKDIPSLKVVLKVLSDPRLAERFRQEADKLALLDANPNICRIKHFFNHGEDFVIAMDYIDGQTLWQKIENGNKLDVPESLKIVSDVLAILAEAHEKDIYHRDIKPSNIMITTRGVVKVIDFGIAKGKTDPDLTIAGTAAGTPAYMAPEQFTPDEKIDYAKVDIYAVGTTLYRLLTGELPFKAENEFAMRDAKLFSDPIKPSKLNSDIASELEKIILKAICKEPEKRYNSVAEMKSAIDTLYQANKKQSLAATKEIVTPATPAKPPGQKKSKMPIIIGFMAVVAIAIVVYFVLMPGDEPINMVNSPKIDSSVAGDTIPIEDNNVTPTGSLVINLIPAGDLYINDELQATNLTDTIIKLDTGIYSIRAVNSKATNSPIMDEISLIPDEILPRNYIFEFPVSEQKPADAKPIESKPVVAKVDSGQVRVACREGSAMVYANNVLMSDHTPNTIKLPVGYHEIKIVPEINGQTVPYTEKINLTKDQILTVKWKNPSD
ncbi:MAG: serine/threonine-protein kinase [Candidatus Zixiibacteriota bacterium]